MAKKEEEMTLAQEGKLKALQAAMSKIEKDFGKGAIMKLGDEHIENVEVIPTGSIALDAARTLERGGNRRGVGDAEGDGALTFANGDVINNIFGYTRHCQRGKERQQNEAKGCRDVFHVYRGVQGLFYIYYHTDYRG